MYNSKYSGQQVEALLDKVSGSTIGGGGGGISEERFDGLDKATAVAITRIVNEYLTFAKAEQTYAKLNDVYTKTEADAKFIDNSELENELIAFMRSDAYHSIHDPQEKAIAAALNSHNDRITVLESGGTGGSYDDTEVRNLISGNTVDIAALLARVEALEAQLSGVTQQLDSI